MPDNEVMDLYRMARDWQAKANRASGHLRQVYLRMADSYTQMAANLKADVANSDERPGSSRRTTTPG